MRNLLSLAALYCLSALSFSSALPLETRAISPEAITVKVLTLQQWEALQNADITKRAERKAARAPAYFEKRVVNGVERSLPPSRMDRAARGYLSPSARIVNAPLAYSCSGQLLDAYNFGNQANPNNYLTFTPNSNGPIAITFVSTDPSYKTDSNGYVSGFVQATTGVGAGTTLAGCLQGGSLSFTGASGATTLYTYILVTTCDPTNLAQTSFAIDDNKELVWIYASTLYDLPYGSGGASSAVQLVSPSADFPASGNPCRLQAGANNI